MSKEEGKAATQLDPTLDFFAGTVAGMAALVVGHPLDTIKVRLQSPSIATKYTGTWHAFRTILNEERLKGLYKGITSPLAGTAFLNGLVFGSYGFFIRIQQARASTDEDPSLAQVALAGAGTGVVASAITTPVELIKIRQQTLLSSKGLPSTYQVAHEIIKSQGVRGLYRGISVTCLRDLGYGAYFATYEGVCRFFRERKKALRLSPHSLSDRTPIDHTSLISEMESFEAELSWSELMIAGGLAGITGWIFTFPFDTIKSRIQGTSWVSPRAPEFSKENNPYNSTLSAVRYSYRTLGLRGLCAGLTPTLIRAVPVNMVTFLVFEAIVSAVDGKSR